MGGASLAYGLGVGQVVLLGAIALCYPPARVQTYTYTPCMVNGSLSRGCGRVTSSWVDLAPACGLLSVAVAAYVIDTFHRLEAGGLQEEFTFSGETGAELRHWDAHFWATVAWFHCVAVFMVCDPVHLYTGVGAGGLMAYGLGRICRPPDPDQSGPSHRSGFGGVLIYMAGAGVGFQSMPAHYPNRYWLAGGVLGLDLVLRLGHVWDRATAMETVANCRVSYASCCALLLAGVYAVWGDTMVAPSASGDDG
jgi:hypothetical protein